MQPVSPTDMAYLLLSTVRYSLWHVEAAPEIVSGLLIRYKEYLTREQLELCVQEIRAVVALGERANSDLWASCADRIEQELESNF